MNATNAPAALEFTSLATVRPGNKGGEAASPGFEGSAAPAAPAVDLYKAIEFLSLAKVLEMAATNVNATYGALL